MKKHVYKSLFSLITALIIILECFPLATFASNDGVVYTYTYSNGESVEYYIDSDGYEYVYENGKKTFVLLPLEKYRMSDEKSAEVENTNLYFEEHSSILPLNNTRGYVIISTLFNSQIDVSLSAVTGFKTYPANADCLRIKTYDYTPWFGNHNINVHLYVRSRDDGSAYDYHYFDKNCTITFGVQLSGRFAERVNVGVVPVAEMTSCKLAVTATAG